VENDGIMASWQVATSFRKIAVSGNIIRFGTNIYGQQGQA
jgi:hypothetical protein